MRGEWKYCACGCGARTRYRYLQGHRTTKHRILEKALIDRDTGCWVWSTNLFKNGYAGIDITRNGAKKLKPVHRVAYETFNGSITEGLQVLHKCDNRLCVNPEHLYLGTQQDNMSDMVAKGHSLKGEKNAAAVLTEAQAREVKCGNLATMRCARKFGVHRDTIRKIRNGINWAWL